MAGRWPRELERKWPAKVKEEEPENFKLCRRVLKQQPSDKDKVCSLPGPQV